MQPPDEYLDLIVIPAVLHIDPLLFMDYPLAVQMTMRAWVLQWIAGGQGMDTGVVRAE